MITITKVNKLNDSETEILSYEFSGLSSDTKPLKSYSLGEVSLPITNGSTFLEMNTGDLYVYDEANETWYSL